MTTRVGFTAISVLLVLAIVVYAIFSWEDVTVVKDMKLNDLIKAGVQLKVEQSRSEFQLSLLIIGVLWALIIAKKDEARIVLSDSPELIMFICANLLLIMSSVFHIFYVEDIVNIYSQAGGLPGGDSIPDVFSSGINNPYRFQLWCLVGGIAVTAATLCCAHKK
jgi:hypothetical protein